MYLIVFLLIIGENYLLKLHLISCWNTISLTGCFGVLWWWRSKSSLSLAEVFNSRFLECTGIQITVLSITFLLNGRCTSHFFQCCFFVCSLLVHHIYFSSLILPFLWAVKTLRAMVTVAVKKSSVVFHIWWRASVSCLGDQVDKGDTDRKVAQMFWDLNFRNL